MSERDDDHKIWNDAYLGKDMEAYYRLDAAAHPEVKQTACWSYGPPLAVTQDADFQRLNGIVASERLAASQCGSFAKQIIEQRQYYLDRAQGRTHFVDSEELRAFYGRAAGALGRVIAEAINSQRQHKSATDVAREERDKIEAACLAALDKSGVNFSGR